MPPWVMRTRFPRLVIQNLAVLIGIWVGAFLLAEWAPGGVSGEPLNESTALRANRAVKRGQAHEVSSPVAGQVERVLVAPGEVIESGEPVVQLANGALVESPHDGILLHGSVRSGQSIQSGDSSWFFTNR